ncbi:acetylornithine deacetylase [Pseudodonghicola flavimaris]|uniref:Acetylornithine deacetylase n=1 Tax=Pseudodonghicola flavimaris TaxID=3050036 RepID=A0ABT7EUZ2_9RHOB|nr:acetylornithine deacetylase [Pseudodonghicola flavimaris]MDK3016166.1 acetylornithine deacetylase [Pseudodonghicola flavimaris]
MPTRLSPREILAKLVSFPSVSRDSNLPLIDWVEGYLAEHGITGHRHYNEEGDKAALFAHAGPWEEGALVLSGHTDVVPVDGQEWTSDPWVLTERDGKLFGRGAVDMKAFDALAIWALVEAQARGVRRPLQLALSYDEEVGCTGAAPMIETMQGVLPKGTAAIIGEPSMMKTVTGHKSGRGYWVDVWGVEVHSSIMHTGVNAILEAAKFLVWENEVNAEQMAATPSPIAAMFTPPWTTLHTGLIEGGTAANITAKHCRLDFGFRAVPDESLDAWQARAEARLAEIQTEMQAVCPEARIEFTERFSVPGLRPETDGAAETFVRRVTGDNATHVVSYGTEAGHFQAAGYSAVVCGPGDIAQAHQPDEFITVSQFEAGAAFADRLVTQLQEG